MLEFNLLTCETYIFWSSNKNLVKVIVSAFLKYEVLYPNFIFVLTIRKPFSLTFEHEQLHALEMAIHELCLIAFFPYH